jgi:hypothetical protein
VSTEIRRRGFANLLRLFCQVRNVRQEHTLLTTTEELGR